MNTVVLLIASRSDWSPEAWAVQQGGERGSGGEVMLERETEWLSIVRDDRVLNDFDEDERSHLGELLAEPKAYLIEWKGGGLVESLVRSIPPGTPAAVDNDHGLLVSVHEVVGEPLKAWARTSKLP